MKPVFKRGEDGILRPIIPKKSDEISEIKSDINNLKQDLTEIKQLLFKLLQGQTK